MTKKILCTIDDTDHAQSAILLAAELAVKLGAKLTICTVNEIQGGMRGPMIYMHDDAAIAALLDRAADTAREHGVKEVAETELKGREIATAVIQYAEQNGFDHIVAGAGHKHGLSKLVLGSVVASIAERAHCTVTIAK